MERLTIHNGFVGVDRIYKPTFWSRETNRPTIQIIERLTNRLGRLEDEREEREATGTRFEIWRNSLTIEDYHDHYNPNSLFCLKYCIYAPKPETLTESFHCERSNSFCKEVFREWANKPCEEKEDYK
jgi:hypothetical protein